MFSEILPTTMRVSKPTVRYSDPEYVARPRHILLKPFQGQPKKYAKRVYRLPEVSIKKSSIPNAGFGLYIRENVSKGQPISIYRRRTISEAEASLLKKKVLMDSTTLFLVLFRRVSFIELHSECMQGNRHIRANHAACNCLDSRPTLKEGFEFFSSCHEVAGLANSSKKSNAVFVDVGFDCVLEATADLVKGAEIFPKYDF